MLISAVVHLKALEKGAVPIDLGPAIHSQFLEWNGEHAEELHSGDERRPYTVSDLKGTFRDQHGLRIVESGQNAWFRLTSFTEAESSLLLKTVLPGIEEKVFSLNHVNFQVQKVAREEGEHPWTRQSSYESLVDQYFKKRAMPSNIIEMEFVSPTTFSSKDLHVPLPMPEKVLESWLKRWNAFSSVSLPREVDELAQAKLALSQYKLETRVVHYDKATWIGFVGTCRFRVLSEDEFWMRLCNLLADFSFYCGTGKKTSFGMGQTRRIHNHEGR